MDTIQANAESNFASNIGGQENAGEAEAVTPGEVRNG